MSFKIETISEPNMPRDQEQWTCDVCGWSTVIEAGGDVCGCPECENAQVEMEYLVDRAKEEHPCPEPCPRPGQTCEGCFHNQLHEMFAKGMKAAWQDAKDAEARRKVCEERERRKAEKKAICATCDPAPGECDTCRDNPEPPDSPSLEDQGYEKPRSDY